MGGVCMGAPYTSVNRPLLLCLYRAIQSDRGLTSIFKVRHHYIMIFQDPDCGTAGGTVLRRKMKGQNLPARIILIQF
jgi:hypothetical protein